MTEALTQTEKTIVDLKARGSILVDGATGFLGSHLVAALLAHGADVRCLVHSGAKKEDIDVLAKLGAKIIQGDLSSDSATVSDAFKSVKVAVHLIGSIAPRKGLTHEDLHVGMTRAFVEKAKQSGAESILMVTALGTRKDASSSYHATKFLAEECVRESGLPAVILRPSLLVGRQIGRRDSKLVQRLLTVIATKKAIPLVNGGTNKLQPLFIGDMSEAAVVCIDKLSDPQQRDMFAKREPIELGGDEVISMHDFVGKLMNIVHTNKSIIKLPYPVAMAIASVAEMLQDVPVLSKDQVRLSMRDNVCSANKIEELLGHKATPLDAALGAYSSTAQGG